MNRVVRPELQQLCGGQKLERDKGKLALDSLLQKSQAQDVEQIEDDVLALIDIIKADVSISWQCKHGCLVGCGSLISKCRVSNGFVDRAFCFGLDVLTDPQERVRLADGQLFAVLVKKHHSLINVDVLRTRILTSIEENIDRGEGGSASLPTTPTGEERVGRMSPSSSQYVLHECAGWNELETSLKCLQLILDDVDHDMFDVIIGPDRDRLVKLIDTACHHSNRFVRETSYFLLGALAHSFDVASNCKPVIDIEKYAQLMAQGLADNWSQVRMAASVATRSLLASLPQEIRQKIYGDMLGPMCLNRYYLAEGVRIYSQETWKLVAGSEGTTLVQNYLQQIVDFYLTQTQADNHAVREAACHVIAELATKLPRDCVLPFVEKLIEALIICFKDESWPVRDAACLASAQFLCAFKECGENKVEPLLPLFWTQLQDCIASVRQGAAESLASLFKHYTKILMDNMWSKLVEGLKKVEQQPKDDDCSTLNMSSGLSSDPAVFGVARQIRTTDIDKHTDQQMYSCGSLAPKMGKGGGCSAGHSFTRPPSAWECTDGCVRLVAALCQLKILTPEVEKHALPLIITAAKQRQFVQHVNLLETICRSVPIIAESFGKRTFKNHLHDFIEPIFYALNCGSDLCAVAAQECIVFLAKFLGPSILRGRIEMTNPECLNVYDKYVVIL